MPSTSSDSENDETHRENQISETILYELLVHTEWQEPEVVLKSQDKIEDIICGKKLTKSGCAGTSSWFSFNPWTWLTDSMIKVKENQIVWQFAVGGDGAFVAVLQETILEIRSSKDDYSTVVGRTSVLKDPYVHWRKLEWSPDCSMLAIACSNGKVEIFDLIGTKLFSIGNMTEFPAENAFDNGEAPCALLFMEPRVKKSKWSYELLVCNLKGQLNCYLLSTVDGYEASNSFDFIKYYPSGISSICYHPAHNLLFVSCGNQCVDVNSTITSANHYGISAWRILSDDPYYRKGTLFEEDKLSGTSKQLFLKVSSLFRFKHLLEQTVFKMTISPDGKKLVALHTSGTISVWEVPSLRLHRLWRQTEQPKYNFAASSLFDFHAKKKREQTFRDVAYISDANWWTDDSLILARNSGSITVSSVESLKNQLGESCEWFEPYSKVSSAFNKGFLALECDCQIQSRKHPLIENNDNGVDSSDDEEISLISKPTKYIRNVLYYMTDSERFQPPRRRPKILTKMYRLVSLKSTTPEELFTRKMDLEEYGEAISLAMAYGLDTDLVYQRQWRKTPVSVASIQDYLSKIKKRSWVLHECLERVPEDIDAARELLAYGLRGSSLETFLAIGRGEDDGKFKICAPSAHSQDYVLDDFDGSPTLRGPSIYKKSDNEILKSIDIQHLKLEQKQLCQVRYKLLTYLDRLTTYEVMLGGMQAAAENFDPKFYQKFRSQSLVDATIEFARNSNWQFVEIMFTYHRETLLAHRLAVLGNFPETASCYEYRHLLPEYDDDLSECDDLYMIEGEQRRLPDWCEHSALREINASVFHQIVSLYEECPELIKYHGLKLENKLVTDWYIQRTMEIEERSCLVDNALELVKLGRAKNIQGLENLHDDLLTLETLVYDCQIDFCLEHYRALSDIQRVTLLMSTATDEAYIKCIRRWLLPYLDQCEKRTKGSRLSLLRQYIVNMAKDDLTRCVQIFHRSRIDMSNPIISSLTELMDIAIECVYVCNRNDQLSKMKAILECLPSRGFGPTTSETVKLHGFVDEFERHLQAAFILNRNQIPQTIKYIRDCQDNSEEVKLLLTRLLRNAGRNSSLSETQWKDLLTDILNLQKVFQCVSPDLCYEIYVESLLCSNLEENIKRAGQFIECSNNEVNAFEKKVRYSRAVPIVVGAAKEYFNSSSSLTDPCMDLARLCLELIQDCPESVQLELDLISAVGMLGELSVSILPLQVRLCENRIKLIEKVLDTKSDSYRKPQMLLKLAHFLHIAGDDKFQCEGSVLTLAAGKALENEDYEVCYNRCEQIIMAGYNAGWEICYQLGQCKLFTNLEAKCHLLSFAVTYCSPDQIEVILKSRFLIELQLLKEKIHSRMDLSVDDELFIDAVSEVDEISKEKDSYSIQLKNPIIKTHEITKKVFQSTSKATKEVVSLLTNQEFWGQAVSWMRPLRQQNISDFEDVNNNDDFQVQGIGAFYNGLVTPHHVSNLGPDYMHCSYSLNNQALEMSRILLRSALLAETLTGEHQPITAPVLASLGQDTITEDCALGLAYLLALNNPTEAEESLKLLPNSSVSLHVRCYYFALYILNSLRVDFDAYQSWLYLQTPDIVVQIAMHLASTKEDAFNFDNGVKDCIASFRCYYDTLADLLQGQVLHQLSRGVDVVRFSCDAQYKRDTILGLAMTMDDAVYNTAVTLAEKHNIPLYEVFRTHIEYLFSESSLSADEIHQRIEKLNMISEFQKNDKCFANCLLSIIFPTIAGTDHAKLILFYQLLQQFGQSLAKPEPSLHIKLLREIESVAPGLNYKLLTDEEVDTLELIKDVLTKDNVDKFANIASQLLHKPENLDSSSIYCLWIKKLFMQPANSHDVDDDAPVNWIQHYELCNKDLCKLRPKHIVDFVNNTLFSEQGCTIIAVKTRKEILKRILLFTKKQKGGSSAVESDEWKQSIKELNDTILHLNWMQSDLVLELKQLDDDELHRFLTAFDQSRSVESSINLLLEKCVLEGNPFTMLQQLISITPSTIGITVGEVVIHAIHHVLEVLKGTAQPRFFSGPVETLERIIVQTQEYVSKNNDLLIVEDMLTILRPFCADTSILIKTRLNILELLEQAFTLDDDDSGLILLYRTQIFVAAGWPDREVYPADVGTEDNRLQLFGRLVENCTNFQRALVLTKLLTAWPRFSLVTGNPEEHPWFKLFMVMLQCPEPQHLDLMVSVLREHLTNESFLNAQLYKRIIDLVRAKGSVVHTIKIALVSESDEIHKIAIEEISKCNKNSIDEFDEQIMNLILQRHLLPTLVRSHLYGNIIDYILGLSKMADCPDYLSAKNVAKQLYNAGYEVEAGSLLLQSCSVPILFQSFQSALTVARNWLS